MMWILLVVLGLLRGLAVAFLAGGLWAYLSDREGAWLFAVGVVLLILVKLVGVPWRERAGVLLAVTFDSGPEGAPAVVLVHGMSGTAWPLDALEGRVVAYDRRGYGDSGAPEPYVQTTVHEHAEDLAALVRAL